MRDFQHHSGRLRALGLQARMVYTVFLASTLAGLVVTSWLTEQHVVGLDLSRVGATSAGETPASSTEPAAGPRLELPAEADGPVGAEPASTRQLLEVTHFHLFSMPVYLLILSHLFMLTGASVRAKTAWIMAGTLGMTTHIIAPWVARGGGLPATLLYGASGALLLLAFAWMSVASLWDMWGRAA